MQYMILASGSYDWIEGGPRQLWEVGGEAIIDRTIRLLREAGVDWEDIFVVTDNGMIDEHISEKYKDARDNRGRLVIKPITILCPDETYGLDHWYWVDAFPISGKPVTYIFGDVVFTEDAIRTIVGSNHRSAQFFASAPPFAANYIKRWAEPFAFRIFDGNRWRYTIEKVKQWQDEGKYPRVPIAWELWHAFVYGSVLSDILRFNYEIVTPINDGTCDVDSLADLEKIRKVFKS